MIFIRSDGQQFDIDCEFFADESTPNEWAKEHCFDERGNPKCPLWRDCWMIYTKRR